MISAVKRAGVPIRRGVRGLRAVGRRRVERVAWEGGELAADYLLLHEGRHPEHPDQPRACSCGTSGTRRSLLAAVARCLGPTSLPNIAIAGDGGGIAGAEAAVLSGRLAALDAAMWLGHIGEAERDRRARPDPR